MTVIKRSDNRPKDMIGQDGDGQSEDRPKVRPKDVIGRDEDGPSEDRPNVRPKDVIGQDEDGLSENRPIRSLRRLLNRYNTVIFFGKSTRSDGQNRIGQSDHLDIYLTVINGHSLRSHPQDRMVRP